MLSRDVTYSSVDGRAQEQPRRLDRVHREPLQALVALLPLLVQPGAHEADRPPVPVLAVQVALAQPQLRHEPLAQLRLGGSGPAARPLRGPQLSVVNDVVVQVHQLRAPVHRRHQHHQRRVHVPFACAQKAAEERVRVVGFGEGPECRAELLRGLRGQGFTVFFGLAVFVLGRGGGGVGGGVDFGGPIEDASEAALLLGLVGRGGRRGVGGGEVDGGFGGGDAGYAEDGVPELAELDFLVRGEVAGMTRGDCCWHAWVNSDVWGSGVVLVERDGGAFSGWIGWLLGVLLPGKDATETEEKTCCECSGIDTTQGVCASERC